MLFAVRKERLLEGLVKMPSYTHIIPDRFPSSLFSGESVICLVIKFQMKTLLYQLLLCCLDNMADRNNFGEERFI